MFQCSNTFLAEVSMIRPLPGEYAMKMVDKKTVQADGWSLGHTVQ